MLLVGHFTGAIPAFALILLGINAASAQDPTTTVAAVAAVGASGGEISSNVYTTIAQFGTIQCDGDHMRIDVNLDQLAAPTERYTLLDVACRPNRTEKGISFEFGTSNCGTVFEGNETHWIVSNSVVNTNPLAPPMPGSVLLHNIQTGTFRCVYPRTVEQQSVQFTPSLIDYEYPMKGISTNPISLGLFTDNAMRQPVDISRKLKLNTTIYARLARSAVGDLGTFIVPINCNAFPSADPSTIQPMLSKDSGSCWALREYAYISNTNDDYMFSFPVFGFVARGETITMQCFVNTCKIGNTGEDCKIPKEPCDFGPDIPAVATAKVIRRGIQAVAAGFSVETEEEAQQTATTKHAGKAHRKWVTPVGKVITEIASTKAAVIVDHQREDTTSEKTAVVIASRDDDDAIVKVKTIINLSPAIVDSAAAKGLPVVVAKKEDAKSKRTALELLEEDVDEEDDENVEDDDADLLAKKSAVSTTKDDDNSKSDGDSKSSDKKSGHH